MALVSNPHSAYSPRLPWLGGIAGLLAGGAILYFWPQWNRTWLSLVPAPVSVYTRFLGVTLEEVPLITYGHQALLGFLMVLLAPGYGKSTLAAWMMHNPASSPAAARAAEIVDCGSAIRAAFPRRTVR